MVRGLISFAVVSVAVVIQLTIVDRIAFPGGTGPTWCCSRWPRWPWRVAR